MFKRILKDLGITFLMSVGERIVERAFLPGIHLIPVDPAHANDIMVILGESIGVFMWIWLFDGTLYVIAFLLRRPLKPRVPLMVAALILVMIFASSLVQWWTT